MELVSIIVLGYNIEKYITRCLESITNQTYQNLELIFIDDCSKDDTWKVVNDYVTTNKSLFSNVVLHQNKENKGSATNRNIGLSLSSGNYFTFVDGDDWIEPHGIENMMKEESGSNADIIVSEFIMDREGETEQLKEYPEKFSNIDLIKSILMGKVHGSVCNKLYKKKFVEEQGIKFVDGANFTEDLGFNVKALANTKNVVLNTVPYYHYCIRTESETRNTFSENDKIDPRILQKFNNIRSVSNELDKSGLMYQVKKELNYCKLGTRLPLLSSPNKEKCRLWRKMFPESNISIPTYDKISFAYKLKLVLLMLGLDNLFMFIDGRHLRR